LDTGDYEKGLDEASKKTGSFADKLKNGMAAVGKAVAVGAIAAATALTALGTSVIENYAEYEQLVGGVETLFAGTKQSYWEFHDALKAEGKSLEEVNKKWAEVQKGQTTVLENAANAYKTAGLSANEYMSTVTSFSASLLQSLGGDTKAAAEYADMAITDMSDNANKMGTDMAMIQNAYQGFAKQNYTMLDNLKLGYGGTQEEMQRLLEDAEKLPGALGREFDISNYADVVEAIHLVQTEMGITGTTAAEASETISGSMASAKAAWENLLTGIADPEADFSGLVSNFVESVGTAADNLIPRVEITLNGLSRLIEELFPKIMERIPAIIEGMLPGITTAAVGMVESLISGISSNQESLTQTAFDVIMTLVNGFIRMLPKIVKLGLDLLLSLANGISQSLPTLIPAITDIVLQIVAILTNPDALSSFLDAGLTIITELAFALVNAVPQLVDAALTIIETLTEFLLDPNNLKNLALAALEIIVALGAAIVNSIPHLIEYYAQIGDSIISFFTEMDWSSLGDGILNAFRGIWTEITEIFSPAVDWFKEKFQAAYDGIVSVFGSVGQWFNDRWNDIKNFLEPVKDWFQEKFQAAYDAVTLVFQQVGDWFGQRWDDIQNALADVSEWFQQKFQAAYDSITRIFNGIGSWFSARWTDIKNAFSAVSTWFKEQFQKAYDGIVEVFGAIGEWFSQKWEDITDVFSGVADFFSGIFEDAVTAIKDVFGGIVDWFSDIRDKIVGFFDGIADKIRGEVNDAEDAANNAGGGSVDGSHASGLDYVPYDNYIARLHRGEMVVPADEAEVLRENRGLSGGLTIVQNIYSQAQTAADLMVESRYEAERALLFGV